MEPQETFQKESKDSKTLEKSASDDRPNIKGSDHLLFKQ